MKDYPEIVPPFAAYEGHPFHPFERDPETLVPKWAIPGTKGLEHRVGGLEKNHEGVLSSDPLNHAMMVAERQAKVEKIADFIPELTVNGPESGKVLVVGWGGTFGHILTACHEVGDVPFAHFDYIYPVPRNTREILSRYEKILVCELNNGQFAAYLRNLYPEFHYIKFNKVQGQPFLVEELTEAIKEAYNG